MWIIKVHNVSFSALSRRKQKQKRKKEKEKEKSKPMVKKQIVDYLDHHKRKHIYSKDFIL
jgi:hypothetical protein